MAYGFQCLYDHMQGIFRQMQLRNTKAFRREMRAMRSTIDALLNEQETRRAKRCEGCRHWDFKSGGVCTCEDGPRQNEIVGAANSCDRWKKRTP